MTLRRFSSPVLAGLALCIAAGAISTPVAAASSDPEATASRRLIAAGEQVALTGSPGGQFSQRLHQRLGDVGATIRAEVATRVGPL